MAPPHHQQRGGRFTYPDPRTIARALAVLQRLPAEALADLTERLVDRLDAAEPDCDLEQEEDACPAGECGGVPLRGDGEAGDPGDAEADDRDLVPPDEPLDGRLRAERDGFVVVYRRPFVLVTMRGGRPVRVRTVVAERRA